jgi:chromosome segregation ATPase
MGKRNQATSGTVLGFIEGAYSEIESLYEEMSEWRDNLEENFSQTTKYEEVSSVADLLENLNDIPDVSEALQDLAAVCTQDTRTQPTRARRAGNAAAMLGGAISSLEERRDILNEEREDAKGEDEEGGRLEAIEEELSDIEELLQVLEEAQSELEGIDFPRAFG